MSTQYDFAPKVNSAVIVTGGESVFELEGSNKVWGLEFSGDGLVILNVTDSDDNILISSFIVSFASTVRSNTIDIPFLVENGLKVTVTVGTANITAYTSPIGV